MSRSGAAAVLERGSQAVMRQRLFSGRWLTVMSGDDLRKRMGAVKVGRRSSKDGSRSFLRRSLPKGDGSSSSGARTSKDDRRRHPSARSKDIEARSAET